MIRTLLLAVFSLFLAVAPSIAQTVTDNEIESVVNDLIKKLQKKGFTKKIMVDDFTDKNEQVTMLGSYLADEFSNSLVNNSSSFTVIEKKISKAPAKSGKSGLQKTGEWLDKSVDQSAKQQDPNKSQINLGETLIGLDKALKKKDKGDPSRKGVDAVVTGTLTEFSSYYRLIVKVVDVKSEALLVSVDGNVTRTESIDEIANQTLQKKSGKPGSNSFGETAFRKDDISFSLVECHQAGQNIDLVFDITNGGDDLDLITYRDNSRAIDSEGGKEFAVASIRLADKINSYQVTKTILSGTPVRATISFFGVKNDVSRLSKIEINCWTQQSGSFLMELRDVEVTR